MVMIRLVLRHRDGFDTIAWVDDLGFVDNRGSPC